MLSSLAKIFCIPGVSIIAKLLLWLNQQDMTDEDHSDSRTEDDYEEGEEAYDDEGNNTSSIIDLKSTEAFSFIHRNFRIFCSFLRFFRYFRRGGNVASRRELSRRD